MKLSTLQERIRDRLAPEWLTPSQKSVWEQIHRFEGPPHRIINIYGPIGSGKSFLGWLMHRERYATYGLWTERRQPIHPRLVLDNAYTDRTSTRALRPEIDALGIRQIILLSRQRVDEQAMPAFQLTVTVDDVEHFRATLYRYLNIIIPEEVTYENYRDAIETYLLREQHGRK